MSRKVAASKLSSTRMYESMTTTEETTETTSAWPAALKRMISDRTQAAVRAVELGVLVRCREDKHS